VCCSAIDEGDRGEESVGKVFGTIGMFLGIFIGSFVMGMVVGSVNALITKFTKIKEFPLLESTLLLLMSYTSYLIAEALSLSGKWKSYTSYLIAEALSLSGKWKFISLLKVCVCLCE